MAGLSRDISHAAQMHCTSPEVSEADKVLLEGLCKRLWLVSRKSSTVWPDYLSKTVTTDFNYCYIWTHYLSDKVLWSVKIARAGLGKKKELIGGSCAFLYGSSFVSDSLLICLEAFKLRLAYKWWKSKICSRKSWTYSFENKYSDTSFSGIVSWQEFPLRCIFPLSGWLSMENECLFLRMHSLRQDLPLKSVALNRMLL